MLEINSNYQFSNYSNYLNNSLTPISLNGRQITSITNEENYINIPPLNTQDEINNCTNQLSITNEIPIDITNFFSNNLQSTDIRIGYIKEIDINIEDEVEVDEVEIIDIEDVNQDVFKEACEDLRAFPYKINNNGSVEILGSSKVKQVLENKQIRITNSNSSIIVKNFTFTVVSDLDMRHLNTIMKVHLVYLTRQNELKNKESKEKKENPLEKSDKDHSILTKEHHTKKNHHQKNKEFFQLTIGFKDNSLSTRPNTLHKQEQVNQIERLKESKLKEKITKKKKQALKEHKLDILNDSIKSWINHRAF